MSGAWLGKKLRETLLVVGRIRLLTAAKSLSRKHAPARRQVGAEQLVGPSVR